MNHKRCRALLSHRGKGTLEVIRSFDLEGQQRNAQCGGSGLELLELGRARGASRIPQEGNARGRRSYLFNKLKPFGDQVAVKVRQPRYVSAGAGKAVNEAGSHRIRMHRKDDGNHPGRLLCRLSFGATAGDNDIDFEADKLHRQSTKLFTLSRFYMSLLDDEVLSFCISQLVQSLDKSRQKNLLLCSRALR